MFFRDTTETGGNRQGTIGHGRFTVRVAEGMQAARLEPEPAAGWQRSEDGRTFTLEWRNFEPRLDEARRGWSLGWRPATGTPDDQGVKDRLRGAYAPAAG